MPGRAHPPRWGSHRRPLHLETLEPRQVPSGLPLKGAVPLLPPPSAPHGDTAGGSAVLLTSEIGRDGLLTLSGLIRSAGRAEAAQPSAAASALALLSSIFLAEVPQPDAPPGAVAEAHSDQAGPRADPAP